MLQDFIIQTWCTISPVSQELHQGPGTLDGMLSQQGRDFTDAWTLRPATNVQTNEFHKSLKCLSLCLKYSLYSNSPEYTYSYYRL